MAYIGRGIDNISNASLLDTITFTDSAGPYNLLQDATAFTPISVQALVISIDGVIQSPSSYTISAATITFDSVMATTSTNDFIVHNGVGIVNTPTDDSVTTAAILDDAVTTAKILDANVTTAKTSLVSTGSVGAITAKGTAGVTDGYITLNCDQNTHGVKIKSPPHSAAQSYTLTLPQSLTNEYFLQTDGSGNLSFAAVSTYTDDVPTFTSITPSTATNDATSFVIVGTNFGSSGIPAVEFQNTTGGITAATSITRDSATQLTVVATLAVDGTYYIRIELNNGLAMRTASTELTISDEPVWTTTSGSLGTIAGDFSGTVATVAATGDGVEYTEVSGTGLTGAGNANCTLAAATGIITTTDFGGSSTTPTTYNFTIRATDDQAQYSDRAFSLTSSFGATGGMQFN